MKKRLHIIHNVLLILLFTLFFACSDDASTTPKTYTITFQANGGSIVTSKQTVEENVETALTKAKSLGLTNGDKTFVGWGLSPAATRPTYEDGSTIILRSDITLYALWQDAQVEENPKTDDAEDETKPQNPEEKTDTEQEPPVTYTVALYANEGHTNFPDPHIIEFENSTTVDFKAIAEKINLYRDGYALSGWSVSKNGEAAYAADASIPASENMVLYAVWSAVPDSDTPQEDPDSESPQETPKPDSPQEKTYTIYFEPYGGTIEKSSQSVTTTNSVEIVSLFTVEQLGLRREGYEFVGWALSSDTNEVLYTDGMTITLSGDMLLYAVWQEITEPSYTYTITFDANGGEIQITSQTVTTTNSVEIVSLFTVEQLGLRREGYEFVGWAMTSDATEITYTDGADIMLTDNILLYAVWKEYCTLILDANGGSFMSWFENERTVEKNTSVELALVQSTLIRDKYIFLGWATSADTTEITYAKDAIITLTDNITLYAVWVEPCTITLNFNNPQKKAVTMTVGKGIPFQITPIENLDFSLQYFTFLGWAEHPMATEIVYEDGAMALIEEDIKLYAIWKLTTIADASNVVNIISALRHDETVAVKGELTVSDISEINKAIQSTFGVSERINNDTYVFTNAKVNLDLSQTIITALSDESSDTYKGFYYCTNLKALILPDTLETIGEHAIRFCKDLVRIEIPAVKKIEHLALAYCNSLEDVVMPKVIEIQATAFAQCTKISHLVLPNTLKIIGEHAFWHTGISEITIPSSVETMYNAPFRECENLENVYFEDITSTWYYTTHKSVYDSSMHWEDVLVTDETGNIKKFNQSWTDSKTNAEILKSWAVIEHEDYDRTYYKQIN